MTNIETAAVVLHACAKCRGRDCEECKEFYNMNTCPQDFRSEIDEDFAQEIYDRVFHPELFHNIKPPTEDEFMSLFQE